MCRMHSGTFCCWAPCAIAGHVQASALAWFAWALAQASRRRRSWKLLLKIPQRASASGAPSACMFQRRYPAALEIASRDIPAAWRANLSRPNKKEQRQQRFRDFLDRRHPPSQQELDEYVGRMQQDLAHVRKKFFPERRVRHCVFAWKNPMGADFAEKIADVAANDTGLPATASSTTATMMEQWCKRGSWAMCSKCSAMQQAPAEGRRCQESRRRRYLHANIAKAGTAVVPQK